MGKKENTEYRTEKILKMVPEDVKTVLDIGSKGEIFNKNYKTTTLDVIEEADIKQDLNINQELPFPDNSFDMVVVNQILEHLPKVEEIIKEVKRVSKKYVFLGLPNELTIGFRIRFLVGRPDWGGYLPYYHKHFFSIKTIEEFRRMFFGKNKIIKKDYLGAFSGASLLPYLLRDFLSRRFPNLFAKEVFYLIKVK